MTNHNPNRHGAGSPRGGQFAPGHTRHDESGQVGVGEPTPTRRVFPESLEPGDRIVLPEGFRTTVTGPPSRHPRMGWEIPTDSGELYANDGMVQIEDHRPPAEPVPDDPKHFKFLRHEVEPGVLMSLGARNIRDTGKGMAFTARVLGWNKDGTRSRRVKDMEVVVEAANDMADYDVRVTEGDRLHARMDQVFSGNLNHVLLAVDYDGETPFNPRYVGAEYADGNYQDEEN